LQRIVPADRIRVLPPDTSTEAGFDDVGTCSDVRFRLQEIARAKHQDVIAQPAAGNDPNEVVITADTAIVVTEAGVATIVLSQPPDDDSWRDVVRSWFEMYYFGKSHQAMTALCVSIAGHDTVERVVETRVEFSRDSERWLDWYLAGEEPIGKAGGYAIQGAGGLFVSRIEGSLSNVVGLPLKELLELFDQLGVPPDERSD
jgi:septum formation protein